MKYVNATEVMQDENEAYMNAQARITDELTKKVNYVVHTKIQKLLSDAPAENIIPVQPLVSKLNLWLSIPGYSVGERNIMRAILGEINDLVTGRECN